jgi:hypothetical protein
MAEDRFRRLAQKIEALRRKDENANSRRIQVASQRLEAVRELHSTCLRFTEHLNKLIQHDRVELSPPELPAQIDSDCRMQFMLNVRGRVLLIDLEAPAALVSTDLFRKPYILQGEVRFFNQEFLEDARVEEHGLYYCPGEGPKGTDGHRRGAWLFWNGRNYKSGSVDEEYLAGLMEELM